MLINKNLHFVANPVTNGNGRQYADIEVNVSSVLESWRHSIFSFEWLTPEGAIKKISDLSDREKLKRVTVEEQIQNSQPIVKPVLGIGLMDNIEIGSGRAEFLTLAALGLQHIPVHVLKSSESDFKLYLADVNCSL